MAIIGESGVLIYPETGSFQPQVEGDVRKGLGGLDGIAGKLAAGAGLAGGIGFSAALGEAMNVQGGRAKIAAQMTETGADSKMYGEVAGKLFSAAYGDNMEEVNAAVTAVGGSIAGMANASAADLQRVSTKTIDFAKTFDVDVTEAAFNAGQAVKSGLAKNADQAFDLMTASMQRVPAQMRGDFTEAINEYGVNLNALGINGESAFTLLSDAAQGGQYQLDKTGDALKEFTIRSTDMSTASVDAYKALGLNAQDMSNKILAGGDTARGAFDKIIGGIQGIKDPTTQANTAIALFGTPLEDIGVNKIPEFLDGLTNLQGGLGQVDGAADRMGAALNDNAGVRLEEFKRTMTTSVTNYIGNEVLPKLDQLGQWAKNNATLVDAAFKVVAAAAVIGLVATVANLTATAVGWVVSGVQATISAGKQVAAWVMTGAAAIASGAQTAYIRALYIADWIAMAVASSINAAKIAGSWLLSTGTAMATSIASFAVAVASTVAGWVVMGAQSLLAAARIAAAWLIAMGPIGLVIAAVIGLVVLIVANWETIKGVIQAGWEWVQAATAAVWEWMQNAIRAAIDAIVFIFLNFTGPGLIIKHWDTIKAATGAAWDWVTGKIGAGIEWVDNKIDAGMSFVRNAIGGAWDFAREKVGAGVDYIGGRVDAVRERFVTGFQRIRDAVSEKISDAIGIVTGFPERVMSGLGNLGSTLYNKGRDIIQGLIDGATSLLSRLGSIFLDKVPDFIKGPFKEALGINSPSTVFEGYAVNMAEGVDVGATKSRGIIERAMDKFSSAATLNLAPQATINALSPAGAGGDSYAEHYHLNVNSRDSSTSLTSEFAQMKRTARPLRRR